MKLRMTILALATIASGSLVLLAMTKAELTEVLSARLEIEGILSKAVDVSIPDVPSVSYRVVETPNPEDPFGGSTIKTRSARTVSDLKLRFPVSTVPSELFDWHERLRTTEEHEPHSGSLILVDERGGESGRFRLTNCWPSTWSHASITRVGFRGDVVEEVCLVCEDVEIVFADGTGR